MAENPLRNILSQQTHSRIIEQVEENIDRAAENFNESDR